MRDHQDVAYQMGLAEGAEKEREAILKVIEEQERAFLSPQYAVNQPLSSMAERFACKRIADAIRARSNS
jgi:hypothetical protein